ncbi:MAG: CopD family protein [Chloroflexi bacterium]|nr:CopD family protein [Chloroflexota bacterium]
MYEAVILIIHLIAAVIFVGPQVFLAAAVMPAMRGIEDVRQRAAVTRTVTTRFGWLGGGALLVLLVTGIINYQHAKDLGYLDVNRYFIILQVKLTLVTIVVLLTILHGAVFGRRLQRLQAEDAPAERIADARRWSILASIATLAVSLAILVCAALLTSSWAR